MEQIKKEQLKENILEMARFLHEEAVFAYSAYDMLQKLFECEKSYQTEMSLSPYMYYILRTASRDSIILILTRSYEKNAKGRNIDLLMKNSNSFFTQTEKDSSKEMGGSSSSSTVIELPRPVYIPRSWAKLDEEFAEYCKGFSLNSSRFIPLPDSFNYVWKFMKRIRKSLEDFRKQAQTYRDKVLAHNDRDAEVKMKELNEKQPSWGNLEILIQFQLIFTAFIIDVVTNNSEMHVTAFANATDLETTLRIVRQWLAHQNGGKLQ